MDIMYLFVLGFLLILATVDLSVGVANDAVNFMSPAVGAKAAKFRTILIVAVIGIIVGASSSSGMMDVARHGVLQPTLYTFADVMCVFLAVSATDVIVMDIFNTLGMPTSTTVSMVFGLLGGSTALALSKMITEGQSYAELINTDKALTMIIGIFLSVAIAFVFGFIVMWLARVVFTFTYKKHLRWTIAIFGGISITSIIYFLLVVGMKSSKLGASVGLTPEYIADNRLLMLSVIFVVAAILVQLLHLCKVNIFKLIVLFGTFSLAMAFAGNDLVNFIGVPLAGLESYLDFTANSAGVSADNYYMNVLAGDSTLPYIQWFLVGAGTIMAVAVCTSKKAHKVIQTSVNLARQDNGDEVFSSSRVARKTVRNVLDSTTFVMRFVPAGLKQWVNARFNTEEAVLEEGVAFDLVRASVNLVLAGLLIVVGTSLKLPLSTTYVAFMVAMGSSLADRAWGRETAVYRVTGVITVIGGWFITAGAAFILSFTIAMLNHLGGIIAMVAVIGVIVAVMVNNNRKFKKKKEEDNVDTLYRQLVQSHDKQETWQLLQQHVARTQSGIVNYAREAFAGITQGLMQDDVRRLRSVLVRTSEEKHMWKRYRRKEILGMRKIDYLLAVEKNTWFHLGCNSNSQIIYSLKRMLEPIMEHVDNNFAPLPQKYVDELVPVCNDVDRFLQEAARMIETCDFKNQDELLVEGNALKSRISQIRHMQQDRIQSENTNIKLAMLYLSTLQETQEIISTVRHLLRAAKRFQQ
ncbi:MAG: inorganic phosphate transporter [Bacteroidaceae bacterium]|nr:inorganic phosphate transporter [Bacteroidaceae bacterium]